MKSAGPQASQGSFGPAPKGSGRRLGVLLLNMGGPEDTTGVEPFLRALFSDPALIRLPAGRLWQHRFARFVARRRAPRVARLYREIGGGSPIRAITERQAEGLRRCLQERGHQATVAVAMRYAPPSTEEALDRLEASGVDSLVALSLYPQFSHATAGSSLAALKRELERRKVPWPLRIIESFAADPGYTTLVAETIREALETLPDGLRSGATILFSAHGLPESYVRRGDPYADQVRSSVKGTMAAGGLANPWRLSYQSRVGPVRWLRPYTDETIEELGRAGVEALCMVPISFVSDHIETLHEIDIEYRSLAERAGIRHFVRARVFNDSPAFAAFLADLVEREMKEEASWPES